MPFYDWSEGLRDCYRPTRPPTSWRGPWRPLSRCALAIGLGSLRARTPPAWRPLNRIALARLGDLGPAKTDVRNPSPSLLLGRRHVTPLVRHTVVP